MVREMMKLELARLASAGHGERAPGRRSAQRNGCRDRRRDTRVGDIEPQIPTVLNHWRDGGRHDCEARAATAAQRRGRLLTRVSGA